MITIHEMTTKKEMRSFVTFPFKLYQKNPYWVPPIITEELASFDPSKNPVFTHAKARFFVAKKENEIVGRIAAILNYTEINDQKLKKMRFGWFDFIDDLDVSAMLLNKIEEIGIQNELEFIEGPVGFSNLDKVGVLTEGFDEIGTIVTWYNHNYYQNHYEHHGLQKEKEYYESRFKFSNVDPVPINKFANLISKRYELKPLNFKKTKNLFPYVDKMFDLFNTTYAVLPSFVAISDKEKEYFKKKYLGFIDPEFIKFIVDKNDDLVAFAITMPSFSSAMQKANGKLFPFGFIHLLKAKKNSEDAIFYLIGVHPDYQNKGVNAILFAEFHKTFTEKGVINCIRTPELASNKAIAALWKNFKSSIYKKRWTFTKPLSH